MKKYRVFILVLVLAVLTSALAVVHLTTRDSVEKGTIEIEYGGETYTIDISELEYEQVSGIRINGKGEEKTVEALGILVSDVLKGEGIEEYANVTVISDDSYSAQLTAEEITEETRAYLTVDEEKEGLRLIVFEDKDSKRSVQNVAHIVVE